MADTAKRFYSLVVNGTVAELDIYGDIVSEAYSWDESDMNVYRLSRILEGLEGVSQINVNINSYGGEVAEGIAIYNALRRHSAKIVTRCDGMACSIASVIFMAGDERVMYAPSMLMIHNASSMAWGTAADLRKAAEDNEKITSMSKAAYMERVSITEKELTKLMDAETWITPAEALNMGFATVIEARDEVGAPSQAARSTIFDIIERYRAVAATDPDPDDDDGDDPDDDGGNEADPDDGATDEDPEQEPETDPDDDEDDDPDEDDPEDGEDKKQSEQAFRSFIQSAYK